MNLIIIQVYNTNLHYLYSILSNSYIENNLNSKKPTEGEPMF